MKSIKDIINELNECFNYLYKDLYEIINKSDCPDPIIKDYLKKIVSIHQRFESNIDFLKNSVNSLK